MSRNLELHSPLGSKPLVFEWKGVDTADRIIEAIRFMLMEVPELENTMEISVLENGDTFTFEGMTEVCENYNHAVNGLLGEWGGAATAHIKPPTRASRELLKHILKQCYDEAVVDKPKLNLYIANSDQAYGEPAFQVADMIVQCINSESTFIDPACGIGQNVLLVAALTDCKFCHGGDRNLFMGDTAERMGEEFRKWMQWYGKKYSNFKLEHEYFLDDDSIHKLTDYSVVFVNNIRYGDSTNNSIKQQYSSMRKGTKILTSKPLTSLCLDSAEPGKQYREGIVLVQKQQPLQGVDGSDEWPPQYYLHTIDPSSKGNGSRGRPRKTSFHSPFFTF